MNTFCRLIQNEHLGLSQQGSADGQLLLLTAREHAAFAREKFLENRKEGDPFGECVGFLSLRHSATNRFSSTVRCGKMPRPCGTYPIPARARASAGSREMSFPSKWIFPLVDLWRPTTVFERCRLPTPLRPIRQKTLLSGLESHIPKDARTANGNAEIFDREHGFGADSASSFCRDRPRSPLIILHLVERSIAENVSLVQNRDLAAELTNENHVVLDDNDRMLPSQTEKKVPVLAVSSSVMPSCRFINQEKLSVLGEQHADLEPLLLPVSEIPGAVSPDPLDR